MTGDGMVPGARAQDAPTPDAATHDGAAQDAGARRMVEPDPVTGAIDLSQLMDPAAEERVEEGERELSVTRRIRATPEACFDVVVDPTRHDEIDPAGMVVEALSVAPIAAVGDVFAMAMRSDRFGDYIMDSHVTEFEADRVVAWKPLMRGTGDEPIGFRWRWSFEPAEDGETDATLSYDWLDVTNERFLAKFDWPMFPIDHFIASVRALAAAAESHEAA